MSPFNSHNYYHQLHFTEEETKAQFKYLTQVTKLVTGKLKPRQSASRACGLTTPLLMLPVCGLLEHETVISVRE